MGDIVMSSITGGMSQISDMQTKIWQMYNQINNATISVGQKNFQDDSEVSVLNQDFVKALEEQMQKQEKQVLTEQTNFEQHQELGMPIWLNITDVGAKEQSYEMIINDLMNSLADDLNNKSKEQFSNNKNGEINNLSQTPSTETTGSLASLNVGEFKNQAGNFIQKLIDAYKDRGSVIGLNV